MWNCEPITGAEAVLAVKALNRAHFNPASIEQVPVEQATVPYEGDRRSTRFDTILLGAAGGATWDSVSSALAGFVLLHLPAFGLEHATLLIQE